MTLGDELAKGHVLLQDEGAVYLLGRKEIVNTSQRVKYAYTLKTGCKFFPVNTSSMTYDTWLSYLALGGTTGVRFVPASERRKYSRFIYDASMFLES